jgi:hypothetical protein
MSLNRTHPRNKFAKIAPIQSAVTISGWRTSSAAGIITLPIFDTAAYLAASILPLNNAARKELLLLWVLPW